MQALRKHVRGLEKKKEVHLNKILYLNVVIEHAAIAILISPNIAMYR